MYDFEKGVWGWTDLQLLSETEPAVEARTWAKTRGLFILSASRIKFMLFHAGVTEVKMQGELPSSGSGADSYHPIVFFVVVNMAVVRHRLIEHERE